MNILEIRNLNKRFSNVQALTDINLDLEEGHIIGLMGPNGSGKTTLIKLVAGLLTPDTGTISVAGLNPGPETKALISYLPDRNSLPGWVTTKQAVEYYQDFYSDFDKDAAYEMIANLGLQLEQPMKTMSKGTKEKLQLILTMSRKARLYLLDEPIGGVDPATRDYILNTIITNYNPEATILISTHLISDVEQILDQVIFIKEGRIVLYDNVDNIRVEQGKSIDELFREVFRC